MKSAFRLLVAVVAGVLTLALLATTASAQDQSRRMRELFTSPNQATNSDLAFWGDYAFVGYYTGSTGFPPGTGPRGGVRIFDISNPRRPELVRDFACDGAQNDPILWDRNGNGVPDLLLVAVDSTMAGPDCGAARVPGGTPTGWEGVRVFTMSDNPANPFETITPVDMQYADCGAHTITAWTGFAENRINPRLIVYISSYPLGAGPTCGDTEFQNTANPYDEDPPTGPLHGVIQVLSVPLNNPAATTEIASPRLSYPGDDDGRMEWGEKGLTNVEPAAVACHDIVTHMEHNMAGAACAEQGQVWEIDPETGIPDTENPLVVGDDEVSSGGGGQGIDFVVPGAVDFFHSVMFDNDGEVVNWVDESFGTGCPPMTTYQPRPWNPAGGTHKTGRMFFSDMEGNFLSEFHVGDVRPNPAAGEYCSAHMGMTVTGIKRDILVNAWYTGGVNVIDFTRPTRLREIAYYDPARNSGTWSAYPYTGPLFKRGGGLPVYASDGVTNNALAQGMVVYRARVQRPSRRNLVDHLNPQTMDHDMMDRGGGDKGKGKRGRDKDDDDKDDDDNDDNDDHDDDDDDDV
jgi:hypothetical protein